ncbi:hypothetical protein C1H46_006095 [Malus baccata]|uniref:Uncharacterized protein n=1 Tax=Malus baccata TaxID=106549 RepID=A0A540NCJ0_MALBA|nr:hypothetical protein C1H46_006095 [Malus baccata]
MSHLRPFVISKYIFNWLINWEGACLSSGGSIKGPKWSQDHPKAQKSGYKNLQGTPKSGLWRRRRAAMVAEHLLQNRRRKKMTFSFKLLGQNETVLSQTIKKRIIFRH